MSPEVAAEAARVHDPSSGYVAQRLRRRKKLALLQHSFSAYPAGVLHHSPGLALDAQERARLNGMPFSGFGAVARVIE